MIEDDAPLSLSEYLSRPARRRLVQARHNALRDKRREEGLAPRAATSILAGLIGVSERTIERWVPGGVQSCDINASRILEVAEDLAPRELTRVLIEDLDNHTAAIFNLLDESRHGGDVGETKPISDRG